MRDSITLAAEDKKCSALLTLWDRWFAEQELTLNYAHETALKARGESPIYCTKEVVVIVSWDGIIQPEIRIAQI